MFDFLDQVPEQWRPYAAVAFAITLGSMLAWQFVRGRREGKAPTVEPATQFAGYVAAAAKITSDGPIEKLGEGIGLLIQQQIRANVVLEAHTKKQGQTAIALFALSRHIGRLADAYEAHLKAEQTADEIEEKAQALFERRLAQDREQEAPRPRARKADT